MKLAVILAILLLSALCLVPSWAASTKSAWPTQPDDIVAVHNADLWAYIAAQHYAPYQLTHSANAGILSVNPDGIVYVVSGGHSRLVVLRNGMPPLTILPDIPTYEYVVWMSQSTVLVARERSGLYDKEDIWLINTTGKPSRRCLFRSEATTNHGDASIGDGVVSPDRTMIAYEFDERLSGLRIVDTKTWTRKAWFKSTDAGQITGRAWIDYRSLLIALAGVAYSTDERLQGGIWKLDTRTGKLSLWRYKPWIDVGNLVGSTNGKWIATDAPNLRETSGYYPYFDIDIVNTHSGVARRTKYPDIFADRAVSISDDGNRLLFYIVHEDQTEDGYMFDSRTGQSICFAKDVSDSQFCR